MLLSRTSAHIQVMLFYNKQHFHITCRHNFDCHHNVGLLFSHMCCVVCLVCHVTSSTHLSSYLCNFTLYCMDILSKLNRYKSKTKVVWRFIIITLDFVTRLIISYFWGVLLCVLLGFCSLCVCVLMRDMVSLGKLIGQVK